MRLDLTRIAASIAARWSQENFLKYMREHYGLDRLIEYGTQPLPETLVVVNPAWRRLDQSVRRERARLFRLQVDFGARTLPTQPSAEQVQNFERQGGELREKIQAQELTLNDLKEKRRQTPAKLTIKDLPETERFAQLKTEKKHFIDTIKLIAYRAESALAGEIREALAREDDGRALLRRLFVTPANLRPDPVAQTLTVELHRLGSPLQDLAVAHLCQFLTESETLFPTTNLRLISEVKFQQRCQNSHKIVVSGICRVSISCWSLSLIRAASEVAAECPVFSPGARRSLARHPRPPRLCGNSRCTRVARSDRG